MYVGTIDTSIRVAERGMSISRGAKEALDDKTATPELLVEPMLEQTGEALKDIKDISNRFRSIRIALFEVSYQDDVIFVIFNDGYRRCRGSIPVNPNRTLTHRVRIW